ncbi:MAG: hypothetical protein GX593_11920 [Actinomycetales bacterium]|nr:hypothetical protein [Actinomycetales bacterium]
MTHRTMKNTLTRAVVAAVGLVLVAACQTTAQLPATSPSDTIASPVASPSSSDTPSPSPSPEPSPSDTAEPLPEAAAPTAAGDNAILSPADGATVTGPLVTVSGTGTAFEATLLWRVVVAGTEDVVAEDFTMAGSMGEIGPFEFEVELAPGTYQAEVWAPDMSDGEAGGPDRIDLVAVTFVVE